MQIKIGTGFFTLLGVLFIALKLTGQIAWSWFYVLAPILFIPAIAVSCILTAILILIGQRIFAR